MQPQHARTAITMSNLIDKPTLIIILAVMIAACAHGPRVTHVGSTSTVNRLDDSHVFYSLPRTLVAVEAPVFIRSVEQGLLHSFGGDGSPFSAQRQCVGNSNDPVIQRLCARGLKPATASRNNFLLDCPGGKAVIASESTISARLVPIPDVQHVYAVRMRAGAFERLKTSLQFSSHGAPTSFSASGESTLMQLTQYMVAGATASLRIKPFLDLPLDRQPLTLLTPATLPELLSRMDELDADLIELARKGTLSSASREVIQGELQRIKFQIEGRQIERTTTIRAIFDPTTSDGTFHASGTMLALCPPLRTVDDATASIGVRARLTLEAVGEHTGYTRTVTAASAPLAQPEADGLRYRIPVLARGWLSLVVTTPDEDTSGSNCAYTGVGHIQGCIPLSDVMAIAQGGQVRALPRRLGFGSGSMEVSMDGTTGALTSITTESRGAGHDAARTVAAELAKDHELSEWEREAKLLQHRTAVCDARRARGMPISDDCPPPKLEP